MQYVTLCLCVNIGLMLLRNSQVVTFSVFTANCVPYMRTLGHPFTLQTQSEHVRRYMTHHHMSYSAKHAHTCTEGPNFFTKCGKLLANYCFIKKKKL